ncbi:MAG: hypothetical protein FWH25_03875 [Syntrophorhabdaceae bacterium]|nr:hypothetical protein [Syntrophorhabdaceae bacterium]
MCEQCKARLAPCDCVENLSVRKCEKCGDDINAGDEYIIIFGSFYHLDCVTSLPAIDMMEILGIEVQTNLEVAGE